VDRDTVYFHGSVASRSLVAAPRSMICLTVTCMDGVVLARSVFEHGINYRSAMVFGVPRLVTDPAEKLAGLRVLTEHVMPGQWDYARQPSRKELAATALLALSLAEASVKIRTGPPDDGAGPDAELGIWAGVLAVHTVTGDLVADPALPPTIIPPPHLVAHANRPLADRRPS
jgi:nitroimidazol reductase NimA-like FMN-containing flavoprotein (pyridoxamine 5'-phosphate oxidase superfamily)